MKRYITLGLAVVLALSVAVPAMGGPSNPVATTAVSAAKALKVAKKAKQNANKAQKTANSAQSSANAAQGSANAAQTTANTALAQTADVSANDLDVEFVAGNSASDSTTPKSAFVTCPAGKELISSWGNLNLTILPPPELQYQGVSWYLSNHASAQEASATAANWFVRIEGICIDAAG